MVVDEFRAAFDRTYPLAERVARRITGDPALAEDLAAEAFTRLFVPWRRMAGHPHVEAWVLRVTINLSIGAVRRRRPIAPAADEPSLIFEEDTVVLRVALSEALARLPRRQREVVTLRYLTDLSESDVAAVLGVSPGSVKTHLHRGLTALRARLAVD